MNRKYSVTKKGIVIFIMLAMICGVGCDSNNQNEKLKKIYDEYEGNTLLIGGWVTPRR